MKIFSLSLFQSLVMAEYEELAASAGYDSDDSDGADTDKFSKLGPELVAHDTLKEKSREIDQ